MNYLKADIIKAIERVLVHRVCEVCGRADKWLIPSQEDSPDHIAVMTMIRASNPLTGFDFVPMMCGHCSNTRLFFVEKLLEISMAQEGKSDGANQ